MSRFPGSEMKSIDPNKNGWPVHGYSTLSVDIHYPLSLVLSHLDSTISGDPGKKTPPCFELARNKGGGVFSLYVRIIVDRAQMAQNKGGFFVRGGVLSRISTDSKN